MVSSKALRHGKFLDAGTRAQRQARHFLDRVGTSPAPLRLSLGPDKWRVLCDAAAMRRQLRRRSGGEAPKE